MDRTEIRSEEFELLERTLDVYGGDERRWPDDVRERLRDLASSSPAAQRQIAAARALERVLDAGTVPPPDRAHTALLARRIVAKVEARASVPRQTGDAEIIPWPGARARSNGPASLPVSARQQPGSIGGALALLAASLMVGVFVGTQDFVKPIAQHMVDEIGISAAIDPAVLALIDEDADLNEWETR
ncbi:MAG: hypothetical protein RLZ98_1647 [Pseudomonadota bacterium]|jgi:hypothetical protein